MKCELCGTDTFLETHHIVSKSFGGSNKKENLASLCSNCHTDVHRGIWIIEGRFMTTEGYKTIAHRKGELSLTGQEVTEVYLVK